MVVVVAVVVVGIPVVGIMVVVGPSSASRWYALPLLLACMSYNCILFVCPVFLPHTHTRTLTSFLYALPLHLGCMSCNPPAQTVVLHLYLLCMS